MTESLPKDMPENTQFTGYVPDIIGAFSAIDVFVFLSYEENEGMAILEAASVGLPIIVRDIPVYRGWLQDGENCLKASDDVGFKTCLEKILHDADLRRKLQTNAKILAHKNSLEEIGRRTMNVYKSLFS
jgi:1,2-diacylglycerol-3-alpha-glucose alpha-1,2-glucosyltransferase